MDQQQRQRQHQLQEWSMPSQSAVTCQQQFPSHIYATTLSSPSSPMKRGRVISEESPSLYPSSTCDTVTQPLVRSSSSSLSTTTLSVPVSAIPKKARSNNYSAPQSIKPSVLSAMGTLVGGNDENQGVQGYLYASVPMRRRLSGGQIDQYIGEHDKSMDTDQNRPRNMSF